MTTRTDLTFPNGVLQPAPTPSDGRLPWPTTIGFPPTSPGDREWSGALDPENNIDWQAFLDSGWDAQDLIDMFKEHGLDVPQGLLDTVAQMEGEEIVPKWLNGMPSLQQAWIDAWIETGDKTLAREAVREHQDYEKHFAGNLRADGTVHITEGEYQSLIEGYENVLAAQGLNPDIFHELFANLVSFDIDIGEFEGRVEAVRTQIIDMAPSVAERDSTYYGFEMTPEAIFASFLDPTVATSILNRRISVSQVSSSAWEKGFTVGQSYVEDILNEGLSVGQARDFFSEAEAMLPVLQTLIERHADPDDDFDLGDFTQAQVMDDPFMRRKIRRLLAQERSSFGADRGLTVARDEGGSLVGLADR